MALSVREESWVRVELQQCSKVPARGGHRFYSAEATSIQAILKEDGRRVRKCMLMCDKEEEDGTRLYWNDSAFEFRALPVHNYTLEFKLKRKRHVKWHTLASREFKLYQVLGKGGNVELPLRERYFLSPREAHYMPLRITSSVVAVDDDATSARGDDTPLVIEKPVVAKQPNSQRLRQERYSRASPWATRESSAPVDLVADPTIDDLAVMSREELERLAASTIGYDQERLDKRLFGRDRLEEDGVLVRYPLHFTFVRDNPTLLPAERVEMVLMEGRLTRRPEGPSFLVRTTSNPSDGLMGKLGVAQTWERQWFVLTAQSLCVFRRSDAPTDEWRARQEWFQGRDVMGRCPVHLSCPAWHLRTGRSGHLTGPERRRVDEIASVSSVRDVATDVREGHDLAPRYSFAVIFNDGSRWILRTREEQLYKIWTTALIMVATREKRRQQLYQQQQQQRR